MSASLISALVSALSTVILAGIAGWIRGVRKDFRKFMTEHLWLLETTRRNSAMISIIAAKMGIKQDESQTAPVLPTEPVNHDQNPG